MPIAFPYTESSTCSIGHWWQVFHIIKEWLVHIGSFEEVYAVVTPMVWFQMYFICNYMYSYAGVCCTSSSCFIQIKSAGGYPADDLSKRYEHQEPGFQQQVISSYHISKKCLLYHKPYKTYPTKKSGAFRRRSFKGFQTPTPTWTATESGRPQADLVAEGSMCAPRQTSLVGARVGVATATWGPVEDVGGFGDFGGSKDVKVQLLREW